MFAQFVDRIRPGGTLIACADDPGVAALVARARDRGLTRPPLRARRAGRRRAARVHPGRCGRPAYGPGSAATRWCCRLAVPGEHMALNALAALLAGRRAGRAPRLPDRGSGGVRRGAAAVRVQGPGGRRRACTTTTRTTPPRSRPRCGRPAEVAGGGRVVVAFQPHLYSRTRTFADEFGAALALADEVVVLDVYGAREDPEPGVTRALVAARGAAAGRAGALRAAVGGGARRAGRSGPPGRPGAHHGRGRRDGPRSGGAARARPGGPPEGSRP